jgi:hypothetical protein
VSAVREEADFEVGVDAVWKIVGDFGGFITALGMPVELEGEGIGQTRRITIGSAPTVERLEERDDASHRLVYSIVSGPFPLHDYRSTMQLTEQPGGRTHLAWSSTFEPAPGSSDEEACALVRSIYQGGIAAMKAYFAP